jgi:hypothetical protein
MSTAIGHGSVDPKRWGKPVIFANKGQACLPVRNTGLSICWARLVEYRYFSYLFTFSSGLLTGIGWEFDWDSYG